MSDPVRPVTTPRLVLPVTPSATLPGAPSTVTIAVLRPRELSRRGKDALMHAQAMDRALPAGLRSSLNPAAPEKNLSAARRALNITLAGLNPRKSP